VAAALGAQVVRAGEHHDQARRVGSHLHTIDEQSRVGRVELDLDQPDHLGLDLVEALHRLGRGETRVGNVLGSDPQDGPVILLDGVEVTEGRVSLGTQDQGLGSLGLGHSGPTEQRLDSGERLVEVHLNQILSDAVQQRSVLLRVLRDRLRRGGQEDHGNENHAGAPHRRTDHRSS
jgi:hypothetical protein